MRTSWLFVLTGLFVTVSAVACADDGDTASSTDPTDALGDVETSWSEEDVSFGYGTETLHGVVTLPTGPGPHPAVVLVSGSGDETGVRAGTSASLLTDHARGLAEEGFAALRYDPPGVGRSTGDAGLPSFAERTDETLAALDFLGSRSDVAHDAIGLLGWSQGPWIMAMTAAAHPERVAFLVSVVGSGSTASEQQVYGIEAQTRAAGHDESDVAKAVLLGRLLIDWQLVDPIYEDVNEVDAAALHDDRLTQFFELVYATGQHDPIVDLHAGIDILTLLQDEPWTEALHLGELVIPSFETISSNVTSEQLDALKAMMTENLTMDPADFFTQVNVPVLAIFGEDDLNVDSERSAELYRRYLEEAGNDDVTILVLPDVGHDIVRTTPGYWDAVSTWLADHRPNQ